MDPRHDLMDIQLVAVDIVIAPSCQVSCGHFQGGIKLMPVIVIIRAGKRTEHDVSAEVISTMKGSTDMNKGHQKSFHLNKV